MNAIIRRRELMVTESQPAIALIPDDGSSTLIIKKSFLKIPNTVSANDIPSSWKDVVGTLEIGEDIKIKDYVFAEYTNIHSVKFLGAIKCRSYTFRGCSNLNRIDITDISYWWSQNYRLEISHAFSIYVNNIEYNNFVTPSNKTYVEDGLFKYCTSITSVTFTDNITSIGINAFSNCINLTTITFTDNITSIYSGAFSNCTNLTTVNLPSKLKSIYSSAFANTSLSGQLVIPRGVTTIEMYAFDACNKITSIVIPDTVTNLAGFSFRNCTGIEGVYIDSISSWINMANFGTDNQTPFRAASVKQLYLNGSPVVDIVIPDGITTIKTATFSYIQGTTRTITIPASVTSIGAAAFRYCNKLSSITCLAETPPTLLKQNVSRSFGYTNSCPIYVPDASVDAYKAEAGWDYYSDRIKPLSTKPN